MPLSPKQRQLAFIGGFLATATVAFSFGRMTSLISAPVTPQVAGAGGGISGTGPGGSNQENSSFGGGSTRVGGAFSTDVGAAGEDITVQQVTHGQPLEDWLKKLMAQDDDLYRMQNFMRLMEALKTPEDIKAAIKIVSTGRGGGRGGMGGGARATEFGMLMEKLTQLDPKGAIAFAGEQQGGEKFAATTAALRSWTRLDPAAALAWAQTEGAKLQVDFGGGGGRGGFGGGGQGGANGEEGRPQENIALMGVLSQLAKTDIDKAFSAASSTEIGRMGGRMAGSLATEMISQRGEDEAKRVINSLPDGTFKNEYIQQLAGRLADKDAAGTAQWAMNLPAGDAKSRALGQAINEWAQNDATAAGTFLAKLPASAETDMARERYASRVADKDPSGALTWATTITDPERRDRAVVNLASDWMRSDAAAASQWIAQSTISDQQKAALLDTGNGGGGRAGGGGRGAFGGTVNTGTSAAPGGPAGTAVRPGGGAVRPGGGGGRGGRGGAGGGAAGTPR